MRCAVDERRKLQTRVKLSRARLEGWVWMSEALVEIVRTQRQRDGGD